MTDQTSAPSRGNDGKAARGNVVLGRTLVWLGIAGASAALTFFVLRAALRQQPPGDETTERIQDLIDEANRLIKALDEKKSS